MKNFYANDVLEAIDEISTCETPTIIIDHGSDPEITMNNNNNNTNYKTGTKRQIKVKPQLESNNETSLVRYLSPPSNRSRRSPENGSFASTTSSTSI